MTDLNPNTKTDSTSGFLSFHDLPISEEKREIVIEDYTSSLGDLPWLKNYLGLLYRERGLTECPEVLYTRGKKDSLQGVLKLLESLIFLKMAQRLNKQLQIPWLEY